MSLIESTGCQKLIESNPHCLIQRDFLEHVRLYSTFGGLQDYDLVVFPDRSAKSRYLPSLQKVNFSGKTATFKKTRKNGFVELQLCQEFCLFSPPDIQDTSKIAVVDDICDGGITFIECFKNIKEMKGSEDLHVDLYTHFGIYSRGSEVLFDTFNNVHCNVNLFERFSDKVKPILHNTLI